MTGTLSLSQSIVRAVCERDERPDPNHDDTLLITADDLETIIDNHFERWVQTAFNMSLREFQSREQAAKIADAVLGWLVKHDLADADNEYRAADVIAIMDDLAPSRQTILRWLPIERADKSTDRIYDYPGMPRPIGNSEEFWCRDADGRVFLATWADDGKRAYWWDLEGESPVDPIEFMPHPLDNRFSSEADSDR